MDWNIPSDVDRLVASDPDQMWETDEFLPIRLTVMGGTNYGGRDIPLAWQIEFEPDDVESDRASEAISQLGMQPDGYGWCALLVMTLAKQHPKLVDQIHTGDAEQAACVIWVESEDICRKMIEAAREWISDKFDAQ